MVHRYSSQQEVAALKRAQGHPNVVLLHEVLDDKVCMCVHLLHPLCVCVYACVHAMRVLLVCSCIYIISCLRFDKDVCRPCMGKFWLITTDKANDEENFGRSDRSAVILQYL